MEILELGLSLIPKVKLRHCSHTLQVGCSAELRLPPGDVSRC